MASKGIPEKFHPPVTLILPKRMFGSKKIERAFRANWCQQFPWLHYNIDRDAAFCHVYKEQLDDVDLSSIANEFVCGSEHRMHVFGKF